MPHSAVSQTDVDSASPERRGFLSRCLMGLGLVGGYGAFGAFIARFLYPARPEPKGWLFAATLRGFKPGESIPYVTPAGDNVLIARQGEGESETDFIALSGTCPHLGCRVHWETAGNRFFCPCHNGTFDKVGVATGGPPASDGKNLPRYPLKVENGLLFINVPLRGVPVGERTA